MDEFNLQNVAVLQSMYQREISNLERIAERVSEMADGLAKDKRPAYRCARSSLSRMIKRFEESFDNSVTKTLLSSKF